jgi:hypothetical protein
MWGGMNYIRESELSEGERRTELWERLLRCRFLGYCC